MARVFLQKHIPILFLSVLIVLLAVLASDTAYLTIDMTGFDRNNLQVFWSHKANSYSEKNSISMKTRRGRGVYTVPLDNALFIKRVRIDLQQGVGSNVPRPILLHSLSYHFTWLFKGKTFDYNLNGLNLLQGFEVKEVKNTAAKKIIFTHNDPILDFEMVFYPRYFQIIFPIVFILLIHSLLSGSLLKGNKKKYRVELIMQEGSVLLADKLFSTLESKNIKHKLLQTSLNSDDVKIQFDVILKSIGTFYKVLSLSGIENYINKYTIVAHRSGEIE